jgi:hypothetical protein
MPSKKPTIRVYLTEEENIWLRKYIVDNFSTISQIVREALNLLRKTEEERK